MIVILFFVLLFAGSAEATIRYAVPSGGATSGSCAIGTPCTIAYGIAQSVSGDTLNLRTGTYNYVIDYRPFMGQTVNTGKSGAPITIQAYPGNCVTAGVIGPGGGCETVTLNGATNDGVLLLPAYWVVDGLTIDANNALYGVNVNDNGIYKNMDILNAGKNTPTWGARDGIGVMINPDNHDNQFFNTKIHDLSMTDSPIEPGVQSHGFYLQGYNNTVDGLEIYNIAEYGIQIYSSGACTPAPHCSNNIVRNTIFRNTGASSLSDGGAIVIYGVGNRVYNNLVYSGENGIGWHATSSGTVIYNNTIYNNTVSGVRGNGNGTAIRNNIIMNNGTNFFDNLGDGTVVSGNTVTNNLCNPGGSGCALSQNPITAFVNPGTDFHLKAGSLAIDNGTNLGSTYSPDLAGVARPTSGPWEIGAYEFGTPFTCPTVANALVASYGFEGTGADATGNGHTAVLGTGWSYTGSGKYGQGAVSTGASGITVADHDALDVCSGFTFEGWLNLPNTSDNYVFIVKNPDSHAYLFASIFAYCAIGSGVPIGGYDTGTGGGGTACYATPLASGFKHLAVTYDSTLGSNNLKLYLDGTQVATANATDLIPPTTGTLQFCESNFGEICPSGTVIDNIHIYNYARSAGQIATDMATAIGSLAAPTLKLSSGMKFGASSAAMKVR